MQDLFYKLILLMCEEVRLALLGASTTAQCKDKAIRELNISYNGMQQ
jgi:hypothetical protein